MSQEIDKEVNKDLFLISKEGTEEEKKAEAKLINHHFHILATVIFSFVVLIFSFSALIGIIVYGQLNDVQFSESAYIAIIVLMGVSIIGLLLSLIFLSKIKKDIKRIRVIIDNTEKNLEFIKKIILSKSN